MRIFTLGTDHRPPFDFTRILAKHGIEVVFDVRRTPESRDGHFTRGGLEHLCSSQNVSYVYLGNELSCPDDRDFKEWIRTEEFQRWRGIIRGKLEKRVCCILCAERSPARCHRRVIAEQLERLEVEVVHLLDETDTWQTPPGLQPMSTETGRPRRPVGHTRPARPRNGRRR